MDLYVFDKDLNMIGLIDTYDSLIWTERYYTYGDFELELAPSEEALSVLQQDYYLWTPDAVENVSAGVTRRKLMIIETIEIETDPESGNKLIISGRSLESILDRRIVWKQTELDSTLQYAIKRLLNENAISPTSDTGGDTRKISNLIVEDSTDPHVVSLNVSAQFTGDNLYDAISTICSDNNIGFRITMNDNKQFVFKLYAGEDRSYDQTENPYVCFSPSFNNLVNTNYQTSKTAFKNATRIGGEGEGNDRVFAVKYLEDNEPSGLDRRETFTDARSISTKSYDDAGNEKTLTAAEYQIVLQEKGSEKLLTNIMVEEFEAEINSTNQYKPERDFFIGDTVQIVNDYGIQGVALITEMIRSLNNTGYSVYPAFTLIDTFSDLYEEIEFIKSTGTQYIKTDYLPKTTTTIESRMYTTPYTSYDCMFGTRTSNSTGAFLMFSRQSGSAKATFNHGSTENWIDVPNMYNRWLDITTDASNLYMRDNDTLLYTLPFTGTLADSSYELYLFNLDQADAVYSGNICATNGRIATFKIKENDILVRDYIPVKRKSDNKPGLYDKCGKKFYINAGTGEFDYPYNLDDFYQIEYIESNGTQYIDTKLNGKITKCEIDVQFYDPSTLSTHFSNGRCVSAGRFDIGFYQSKFFLGCGSTYYTSSVASDTNRHKFIYDSSNNTYSMDDEVIFSNVNTADQGNSYNIILFARNGSNGIDNYVKQRLWSCKLYVGDIIVRDFIPVKRKSDSKPGLYDKINKDFYTNAGTGEFIIPT